MSLEDELIQQINILILCFRALKEGSKRSPIYKTSGEDAATKIELYIDKLRQHNKECMK